MKISCVLIVLSLLFSAGANAAPQVVSLGIDGIPAGAIVIKERERALYLKIDGNRALRYRVAVPKAGMQWAGHTYISGKHLSPAWSPPAVVKRAKPDLPDHIAGGAPNNPMGAAALTLQLDEIAIHGTTAAMRASVGTSASFGCIRMLNEDVLDLYARVSVGTPVYMRR